MATINIAPPGGYNLIIPEPGPVMRRPCGCWHGGPNTGGWHLCDYHHLEQMIEAEMEHEMGEPKCEGCGYDARQQHCVFDMGGWCRASEDAMPWRQELARRLKAYVEAPPY